MTRRSRPAPWRSYRLPKVSILRFLPARPFWFRAEEISRRREIEPIRTGLLGSFTTLPFRMFVGIADQIRAQAQEESDRERKVAKELREEPCEDENEGRGED